MKFEEFRTAFLNEINAEAADSGVYPHEIFIDKIRDILINDYKLLSDLEHAYIKYDGGFGNTTYRKMHIDAGYCDATMNTLNLLIVDYNDCDCMSINNEFITNESNMMLNFVENTFRGYFKKYDQSTPEAQLAIEFLRKRKEIFNIHLFIATTNAISSRVKEFREKDFTHAEYSYKVIMDVIDMPSIFNASLANNPITVVDINTEDYNLEGIPFIKAEVGADNYEAYLAIVPGKFLADIYLDKTTKLLTSNVRMFLNLKGNVNKGIRKTILNERSNFFAYNNGISTTADSVEIKEINGKSYITSLKNFQIINGGQTTATLASTLVKDKADLTNVFVQMKLTILRDSNADFVAMISKFANSQNAVKTSDLASRSKYYIRMEEKSRNIYTPLCGKPYQTRWYFERAKGQYDQEKFSKKDNKFELINPKAQKFDKAALSKYLNAADLYPWEVAWGGEVSISSLLGRVEKDFEKNNEKYNDSYFKECIAKAILFKKIDFIVSHCDLYIERRAYKNAIVPHTMAKLIYECSKNKKLFNYKMIWDLQEVPDFIVLEIERIIPLVFDVIYTPNSEYPNIAEYCKREASWKALMAKSYKISEETEKSLKTLNDVLAEEASDRKSQKFDNGIAKEFEVFGKGAKYWESLLDMALKENVIVVSDQQKVKNAISYCNGKYNLTSRQSKEVLEIENYLYEKYNIFIK